MAMDSFESTVIREVEKGKNGGILGLSVSVVNANGETIYAHSAGKRSLSADAQPVSDTSLLRLASATKLFTAVAALQCVEQELIRLDDPLDEHLPELCSQPIINMAPNSTIPTPEPGTSSSDATPPFTLAPRTKPLTLRHLLLHTSGLGIDILHPPLQAWRASRGEELLAISSNVMKGITTPLFFEPGEGWAYGVGHDWAGVLVSRLSGLSLEEFMKKHIFSVLNLQETTFWPRCPDRKPGRTDDNTELWTRKLDIVTRNRTNGELEPRPPVDKDEAEIEGGGGRLYSTVREFSILLADLISPSPKVLSVRTIDEYLFTPLITSPSPAASALGVTLAFMQPMFLGLSALDTPVSQTFGGRLVLGDNSRVGRTKGTLMWAGALGCVWFANRERGFAGFLGGGLFPPGDEVYGRVGAEFVRGVFELVGKS